ncbi:MAG: metal-sulfur cluster assembly factor [Spirochaetia bacterium]|jgi:metal-sulfur cluster biosynthetic enzyme
MVSREEVMDVLRNVEDPELAFSIVDLGLVYRVDVKDTAIEVDFTLTYPGCPAEDIIRRDIIETVRDAFGLVDVTATTVWSPLWGPERMSEEARVALGYPI